jgi:hypothetical protein
VKEWWSIGIGAESLWGRISQARSSRREEAHTWYVSPDVAGNWGQKFKPSQSEIQSESDLIRVNPTKKIAAGDEDLK